MSHARNNILMYSAFGVSIVALALVFRQNRARRQAEHDAAEADKLTKEIQEEMSGFYGGNYSLYVPQGNPAGGLFHSAEGDKICQPETIKQFPNQEVGCWCSYPSNPSWHSPCPSQAKSHKIRT